MKTHIYIVRRGVRRVRASARRAATWWQAQDKRYGLRWRVGNGLLALVILLGVVIPIVQEIALRSRYTISADASQLVGRTNQLLTKQLTYDAKTQSYYFNKSAESSNASVAAKLQAQVGTASGKDGDKSLYSLDVPQDFSKGVTYHDTNSQLSFSLVPQFSAAQGKTVNGHIVYPLSGSTQAIYTLKNNGLKEDIVLPKTSQDTMTFTYKLELPKTLEARTIPNSGGNIGIYSADPSLYGDITYGSSKDQAAVEKAREQGAKNYLVFGLPSPTIKTLTGTNQSGASGRFQLNGDQLSVIATGLNGLKGPVSIDPSVVVSSTSDLQTSATNEGNIDFSTSGQINRGGITGGSLSGSWTADTSFTNGRRQLKSVVYNGYIYVLGGYNGTTYYNDVQYTTISSGTLGTWQYTNAGASSGSFSAGFTTGRYGFGAVAYDGYLYVVGGQGSGGSLNDVQYAPINSNGTIGTWASTSSFTNARYGLGLVASGNNLYMLGGYNGTTYYNDVQYAPIHADGTIGSWQYTYNSASSGSFSNGFTNARVGLSAVVYNQDIYILAGNNGSTYYNDVQYAPINSNGTIGTWASTTSFTTVRTDTAATIYGGYLYIFGGQNNGTYLNDVQYAPINANGTLGAWNTTATFTNTRDKLAAVSDGGYVYILGGNNGSTYYNDVQDAQINAAGVLGSYTSMGVAYGASPTFGQASVAANGYLYLMGGDTGGGGNASTSLYYAPLNSNGSVGTWVSATNTFTGARSLASAAYYNGYLYVIGGEQNGGSVVCKDIQYSLIGSSGAPGTWADANGHTAGCNTTDFPASAGTGGRAAFGAATYNGYLYLVGGVNSNNTVELSDIAYAPINANGTVGTWTDDTTHTLSSGGINSFGMVAYAGYLYAFGGRTVAGTGAPIADIQTAPINANGTIGSWTDYANALPSGNARYGVSVAANKGLVYLVGGTGGSKATTYGDTWKATLSGGVVGTWQTSSTLLASNPATSTSHSANRTTGVREFPFVAVSGDFLYVGGGCDDPNQLTCSTSLQDDILQDVQYAAINNGGNGTLNSWSTNATSFTNSRTGLASVAYNGYLYILGGNNGSTYYNDVQYAPITPSGVGTWQYTNASASSGSFSAGFTNSRTGLASVAYNGYLYILGGNNGSTYYNDVQYAPINADGTIGTWQYTNASAATGSFSSGFTNTRTYAAATTYGGYLYLLGGYNGTTYYSDVQSVALNTNGTVGTWGSTTSFTNSRYQLSATTYNGYLYILGGNNGSTYYNDVQYAPLTSGSVGTWVAGGTTFLTARSGAGVTAYDGYLYIAGGYNGSSYLNDSQYAVINGNGSIGQWASGTSFTNTRQNAAMTVYRGNLYLAGGNNGGTYYSDVQDGSVNSMSRVAQYAKMITLGSVANVTSIGYSGTLPGGNAAITYQAASGNGVFGASSPSTNIAVVGACSSNVQSALYIWVEITLDDSTGQGTSGTFPDTSGTFATLTDFTVNYVAGHPATSLRLRNGQTLQGSSAPSVLDTCNG